MRRVLFLLSVLATVLAILPAPRVNAAVLLGQQAEGPPLRIEVIEGEGAVNNIRQRVAREPTIRVVDRNNKPVAGAAITFLLPQMGAGGTFANGATILNVITNQQGIAVASGLQANAAAGAFQINVVASFQGQTATAAIAQSNAAAAATSGVSTGVLVGIGAAVAGAVVAAVVIGGGDDPTPPQPVPPQPIVISFSLGTPVVRTP
jgi:hypothetical protein